MIAFFLHKQTLFSRFFSFRNCLLIESVSFFPSRAPFFFFRDGKDSSLANFLNAAHLSPPSELLPERPAPPRVQGKIFPLGRMRPFLSFAKFSHPPVCGRNFSFWLFFFFPRHGSQNMSRSNLFPSSCFRFSPRFAVAPPCTSDAFTLFLLFLFHLRPPFSVVFPSPVSTASPALPNSGTFFRGILRW